ncbi:MAG: sulfatase [Acidobacteriota bacterium]
MICFERNETLLGQDLAGALLIGLLLAVGLGCSPPVDTAGQAPYYDLTQRVAEISDVGADGAAAVEVDSERRTIWVPNGAAVAYLLQLKPSSVFETKDIVLRGEGVRLDIDLEIDGLGIANLATVDTPRTGLQIPIDLDGDPPVRLALRVGSSAGSTNGGALIQRPELRAARTEAGASTDTEPSATNRGMVDSVDPRPNVLVYLIDTLRSDRLGCYGYSRDVSPNIDAFATEATLFEQVVSQSSWTKASVASMFTGVWPPAHGATGWKHILPEGFDTLAEILSAAGYQTVAFSGNPNVVEAYGMGQGFDEFHRELKRTSEDFNRMAFEWFDRRDPERPFFLYLHTMDPHAPYEPPEPYRERLAPDADRMPGWQPSWKWPLEALPFLSNLYDAEVAFNDASFGALLDELRERDLYRNTLIVLVSDHGEEFKEHGRWRHGATLYAESLEVPMIVRLPGQSEGSRVATPVQQVDLMPTVLGALGLEVPEVVQGRNLLAAAAETGGEAREMPRIFSHLKLGKSPLFYSLMDGNWKLIRTESEDGVRVELFNWREDPGETQNLAEDYPVRAAWMLQTIQERLAASEPPTTREDETVDPELEESLEALGYLE